jgi:cyclophilin family peptidyl-prolyl cis-trans isomerase
MKKLFKALFISTLTFSFLTACVQSADEENAEPITREIDNTGNNYAIITVRDFGDITVKLYPENAPIAVSRFSENAKSGFYDGKTFHRIMADFMVQGGSYDGRGMPPPDPTPIRAEIHPEMRHFYGALSMAATAAGDASDSFYIVNSKNTEAFAGASAQENINAYTQRVNNANLSRAEIEENYDLYVSENGRKAVDFAIAMHKNTANHFTNLINLIENASDDVKARYASDGGVPFLDGGYTVFGYTIDGFDVLDAISAVDVVMNQGGEMSMPIREVFIETIVIKDSI